jgi:Fe-S oxidoreductase
VSHRLPMLSERTASLETCGYCPKLCRAACPVSDAEPRDSLTPWGKMSLAWFTLREDIEADRDVAATSWACTGCMACRDRCDHKNDVRLTLNAARAHMTDAGLAPEGATRVVRGFPELEARTRQANLELKKLPGVRADAEIALLLGCSYSRDLPEEARAAIRIVTKLFGPVRLVDGCCGAPLRDAGDVLGSARAFDAIAGQVSSQKRLIVVDPGCAITLEELRPEPLVKSAAAELRRFGRLGERKVRWHDPCQLGRGLGCYDEPRLLLARLLGRSADEFPRARGDARCSGAGGLLPVTMPEVARDIARRRLEEHRDEGGGTIVTGCASSVRKLRAAGGEVIDLVTLLAQSLDAVDG